MSNFTKFKKGQPVYKTATCLGAQSIHRFGERGVVINTNDGKVEVLWKHDYKGFPLIGGKAVRTSSYLAKHAHAKISPTPTRYLEDDIETVEPEEIKIDTTEVEPEPEHTYVVIRNEFKGASIDGSQLYNRFKTYELAESHAIELVADNLLNKYGIYKKISEVEPTIVVSVSLLN